MWWCDMGGSGWEPGLAGLGRVPVGNREPTARAAMAMTFDFDFDLYCHLNFDSPYHSSVHSLIL